MSRTLGNFHRHLVALAALGMAALLTLALHMGAAQAAEAPTRLPMLPDGRGYEKVSPSDNADGDVYPNVPLLEVATEGGWTELPYYAASNGDAVAYIGQPGEEGGTGREGGNLGNEFVARRNPEGKWEATDETPTAENFYTLPVYQAFNPELTAGLLTSNGNAPLVAGAPAAKYHVPYARNFLSGAYESLLPSLPPNRGIYEFGAYETAHPSKKAEPVFAGATSSFSHVLYMANDALTPEAVDGGEEDNNLYDFTSGSLQLVNLLPNGTPEPVAVFGGPVIPNDNPRYNDPDFSHILSADGDRIFWTGEGANKNIYMREDGTRTVQIDAGVGGGGQYWTATSSGSKVLFTKEGSLYEYDVETGQTIDLVPGGEVLGIVGTSEDLSYVYFVANGALAPGAAPGGCVTSEGASGECNLYVLHEGQPVRFVSALASKDNVTEPTSFYNWDGDWQNGLGQKEAEVTPDGRKLLFSSVLSLTSYDSEEHEELYVYEYEEGALHCVSCNHTGEVPTSIGTKSAYLPVSHQDTYALHWMSDNGSEVFFDSYEPLVPQDTDGVADVYEWERDGSNSCTEVDGCIYLISGGAASEGNYLAADSEGNYLVDASANGSDVFFTTRAKLVPEDQNEAIDLYDAHVGAAVPPASAQCSGTGCQGVPSAPPVFATPSSVTYGGVGNFAPGTANPAKAKSKTYKETKAKAKKRKKGRVQPKKKRESRKNGKVKKGRTSAATRRQAKSNGRAN
jgi:hypothetical protein